MHCGDHRYDIVVYPSRNDVVVFGFHKIDSVESTIFYCCNRFWWPPFTRSGRAHDSHTFVTTLLEDRGICEVVVRADNVPLGSGAALPRESLNELQELVGNPTACLFVV